MYVCLIRTFILAIRLILTLIIDLILTKNIGLFSHIMALINLPNRRQFSTSIWLDQCACLYEHTKKPSMDGFIFAGNLE